MKVYDSISTNKGEHTNNVYILGQSYNSGVNGITVKADDHKLLYVAIKVRNSREQRVIKCSSFSIVNARITADDYIGNYPNIKDVYSVDIIDWEEM